MNLFAEMKTVRFWTQAGIIAALYTVLSIGLAPISFGPVQLRVAEALCVLVFFGFSAVPGLFVGCLLTNAIGVAMAMTTTVDIIFGSATTLLAAILGYLLRKHRFLIPLPAVLLNAVIIGWEISTFFVPDLPVGMSMLWVGIGQVLSCYCIGIPLLLLLQKSGAIDVFFSPKPLPKHTDKK